VAEDASSRDKFIDLFIRMENFFRRLEIYIGNIPTVAMTEIIEDIMIEILSILAIATEEAKLGQIDTRRGTEGNGGNIEDHAQR